MADYRDELGHHTMANAMTPAAKISSDTWWRLARAHLLGARLGEETLTDLLVLEMLHIKKSYAMRVLHPTRLQESRWGADLLVWIRRRNGLSQFLAIQAKKLYPNGHYKALNRHVSPGIRQIDLLDAFAQQYHAVPLYLLYNHFNSGNPSSYWHCCKSFDIEQLGCTLVPSWKIKRAIKRRGQRTFTAIHASATSRPWRCAFDCDHPEGQLTALATEPKQKVPKQIHDRDNTRADVSRPYPEPLEIDLSNLFFRLIEPSSTTALDELRKYIDENSEYTASSKSSSDIGTLYPRKLLIFDYADTAEERKV